MNKNFAKVGLSAEEMRLVTDPAWILTKNSVMGKVVEMMAGLSGHWRAEAEARKAEAEARKAETGVRGVESAGGETLLMELMRKEPKISKGENYKGLPWVMLDFPRVFGREEVCAIRTLFWWGHAFSITLHLKGEYVRIFLPSIMQRREELVAAGFGVAISDDEWAHEHTDGTYGPLGAAGAGERAWFKLSARVGLEYWDEAPERLSGLYGQLLDVLSGADRGPSGDDHR